MDRKVRYFWQILKSGMTPRINTANCSVSVKSFEISTAIK